MIIQDIKINYSITSNQRYNSLEKHLTTLNTGEILIFAGETFYLMDLYLTSIERFIQLLNEYSHINIYIQDIRTELDQQLGYSWYSIIDWPEHVHLFKEVSEISIKELNIDLDKQKRIVYRKEKNKEDNKKTSDIPIDGIYASHQGDLIGLFIDDIRHKAYDAELQEAIILEGLQYLIRR